MASDSRSLSRPMEQASTWTFASALALAKTAPDGSLSAALDDFLVHNKHVLLSPLPLAAGAKPSKELSAGDFSLRGVSYSGATPSDVQMAKSLASALSVDPLETLRIVLQTNVRSPAPRGPAAPASPLSWAHDEPSNGLSSATTDRQVVYAAAVLAERRAILRLASECFNSRASPTASAAVRGLGKSLLSSPEYALAAVKALDSCGTLLAGSTASSAIHTLSSSELLLHMINLCKLLYEILLASAEIPSSVVNEWFSYMQKSSFALSLAPAITSKEHFTTLHALFTIVTLQLFELSSVGNQPSSSFINDPQSFSLVDTTVCTTKSNNIIRYAWLIVIYRKCVLLEEDPAANASFLQVAPLKNTQSSLATLQQSIHNAPVFREIEDLNSVLKFDEIYAVVLADLVTAALPLVTFTDEIASCVSAVLRSAPSSSVEKFFDNENARNVVVLSRAKFPVSINPYIQLCSINGNFALHEFQELKSFMAVFDTAAFRQMYEIDAENTDLVKLTQSIDLYPPYEPNNKLSLFLPEGTKAKIIATSDSEKVLATFLYKCNGWAFLGRVLENISKTFDIGNEEKMYTLQSALDLLIGTSEQEPENVSLFLEYMSAYTDDCDIIDVFFRLFEQSMHSRNVTLSKKLLQIFARLMSVASSRIWPYMSSSSLLSNKGKDGFSSILFGSIETIRGDYSFTISLVKFVFALAENCLAENQDYTAESKGELLAKFVEHLIQVFDAFTTCKFNGGFQKFELGVMILDVFRQILETIYLIDSGVPEQEKPTRVFSKASSRILDAFLFTDSDSTRSASSIFETIHVLATPGISHEARDISGYLGDIWVSSALRFSTLLVTIRSSIKARPSIFEKELFAKSSQLVAIYAAGGQHRKVVLDLLTALTCGVWEKEAMPSMLSHLGSDNSEVLLHSLATDLENPFDYHGIKISIYDFLCSIMEANQQGLAVLFISGRDVFGELSKNNKETQMPKSLLSILKRNISDVKFYPPTVTVHLLDAISLVFNSWTTSRNDESDVTFVNVLISMLQDFEKTDATEKPQELVLASYNCKLYAKISEILSLVLFTTKNETLKEEIARLLSSEAFLAKIPDFFTVTNYQTSLYEQVKSRFALIFPGHDLSRFALSIKKRNRFGVSAVFDLLLLDSLFQKNPQWKDLRNDIIGLSVNIQYYSTQVALSKSVGALLTTFCRKMPKKVSSQFCAIVDKLLFLEEPKDEYCATFSAQQYYERIELSFLILYTIKSHGAENAISSTAFSIIDGCNRLMENPDVGYLNVSEKKTFSYRSLLRIAHVALSSVRCDDIVGTHSYILQKLFDFVVSRGTCNIIVELQNDVYLSRTDKSHKSVSLGGNLDDLRLILSILKGFVSIKLPSSLVERLLHSLQKHNTVESILSLYAFSHLILVNDEPVFAQLSMMFLQQFLAVPGFAEKFITPRVFSVMRESVISQPLRQGGVTIANAPQLHLNWTNGVLPILVACLHQGQGGDLDEVVVLLRAFSKQIESCVESWSRDSASLQISTAGVFETTQILYIYQILSSLTKAHGIAVSSPTEVDMSVLPGFDTQQKRDDFVDFVNNLLKHPKFLASRIYPSSREEEALVKENSSAYQQFVTSLIDDIGELKELIN